MTENLQLLAEESCNEAEEEDHGMGACSGSPSPAPLLLLEPVCWPWAALGTHTANGCPPTSQLNMLPSSLPSNWYPKSETLSLSLNMSIISGSDNWSSSRNIKTGSNQLQQWTRVMNESWKWHFTVLTVSFCDTWFHGVFCFVQPSKFQH